MRNNHIFCEYVTYVWLRSGPTQWRIHSWISFRLGQKREDTPRKAWTTCRGHFVVIMTRTYVFSIDISHNKINLTFLFFPLKLNDQIHYQAPSQFFTGITCQDGLCVVSGSKYLSAFIAIPAHKVRVQSLKIMCLHEGDGGWEGEGERGREGREGEREREREWGGKMGSLSKYRCLWEPFRSWVRLLTTFAPRPVSIVSPCLPV